MQDTSPPATAYAFARPAVTPDPIDEARRLLRTAARLPYSAARPDAWLRSFRSQLSAARRALVTHVTRGERLGAAGGTPATEEPRLEAKAARQRAEHSELLRRASALVSEAERLHRPDIFRMVELSEETMALALAVEHHRRRLVDLEFEATHRDLGAGG